MSMLTALPDRAVLALTGEDRIPFLQGLVSNDVTLATPSQTVWAAFLTPQGKWIADFFIHSDGDRLLLDVEAAQAAMLAQKLSRYRLRAKVAIAPEPLLVHAGWNSPTPARRHPRPPPTQRRLALPLPGRNPHQRHPGRLRPPPPHPRPPRRLPGHGIGKTTLLEANFDALNGVSWTKGCYMGQELTARTKYRGLLKRHLVPVAIDGPPPPWGTPIHDGKTEIGAMRSTQQNGPTTLGLALIRMDATTRSTLRVGTTTLTPRPPAWLEPEPI